MFTVLPFGLSSACYIFTKLLRPLVRYWRSQGLRVVVYLDDGLGAVSGQSSAVEASTLVRSSLANAGFVAHPTKSNWEPTQCIAWLGFVTDLARGQVEVPQEKIVALQQVLTQTKSAIYVRARKLASIVSSIISMGLAIGPVSRFRTRSLYAVLDTRQTWCDYLLLPPEVRDELAFWYNCLADYDTQPIWHSPSAMRVVYTAASATGYGGYVVEHGPCVAYGQWTAAEESQSSTWRELTAVLRVRAGSSSPKVVQHAGALVHGQPKCCPYITGRYRRVRIIRPWARIHNLTLKRGVGL